DSLTGNRYLFAGANPTAFFEDGHGFFSKLIDKVKSPMRAIKRAARRALPALSFVPVVGTAIDTFSALTGRDWLNGGKKLSGAERALMLSGAALGLIPGVGLAGKAALRGASKLKMVSRIAGAIGDLRSASRLQRAVRFAQVRAASKRIWSRIGPRLADETGSIGRRFTRDQDALIQLAKEAKRRGGVALDEARILRKWADEYNLPSRGPERHLGRRWGSAWHIHIGPVRHIWIRW
ncbi:MAG: pre-toxin TG domain-containing protein, partial [Actinomycetota bacterium]